jgi:signal transduction histidine kinase/ligand-binding sensor domain-containing protein
MKAPYGRRSLPEALSRSYRGVCRLASVILVAGFLISAGTTIGSRSGRPLKRAQVQKGTQSQLNIPLHVSSLREPYFDRYDAGDGLSFSSVYAIHQDRQGFIWIATEDGLNRFDGAEFRVYKSDPSKPATLSASNIGSIAEDKLGRLWVGTNIAGADRFVRTTQTFVRYDMRKTPEGTNACWSFVLDSTGGFWAMTAEGLRQYDYQKDRFIAPRAATTSIAQKLTDLAGPAVADKDGTLWVAGQDEFGHYDPHTGALDVFSRIGGVAESAPHGAMHLVRDGGNGLWITGLKGLQHFDIRSHQYTNYYPAGVSEDERNFLFESIVDDRGDIWCGSMHTGLVRFDTTTKKFTMYRADPHNPHALPDNRVMAVYQDNAHTIWSGSLSGLARFNLSQQHFRFVHHDPTDPASLSSGPIRELAEDRNGNVWIGSDGDGLNCLDPATQTCVHYRHDPRDGTSLSENSAIALTIDSLGHVWVGTWGSGLNLLGGDEKNRVARFRHFRYIDSTSAVSSDYIWDLFTDTHGIVWASTWGGGVIRIDPRTLGMRTYRRGAKDPHSAIHSDFVFTVRQMTDTDYWVGNTAGIEHFNPNTGVFTAYHNGPHTATSWLLNNASAIHPAAGTRSDRGAERSVWITNYAGLIHFDPQGKDGVSAKFQLWDRSRGLPTNSASAVLTGDDSSCWISTRSGLVHAFPFEDTLGLRFRTYDAADGLESTDFSSLSAIQKHDGKIMLGTVNGLIEFDPHTISDNPVKPPIVLTGFKLFNKPVSLDTDIAALSTIPLEYRDNVISFSFAALNFIRPEWNKYAHKLIGFDREWVYSGNKHEASYTNLDPGTYQFVVRGTNNDGVWSDKMISVTLVIAPPFWRTTWFSALCGVLIFASIYSGVRLRIRSIKAHNRNLEQQVRARTSEVAAQRDKLRKAYDDLKQAEVQLVQSEKMASLGQLTAGIAHEINNPINFISGNIEPLKRDLDDILSLLEEYERLLVSSSEPDAIECAREAVERKREEVQLPHLLAEVRMLMAGMAEGAARTSTIVRGLRNFSRLDQNALKLVDIEEGIESTIALLQSRWRGRISIERSYDSAMGQIECFPGELNQVFMNLLSNAIEAIPNAGTIRISTKRAGDLATIVIQDSGEGIDAAVLTRIFEPFFTTKPVGSGTGLGLSISYGIVQKHHGTIEFESAPASGTRAIVTIPVVQPASTDEVRNTPQSSRLPVL